MLFGWLHFCWRRLIMAVLDGGGLATHARVHSPPDTPPSFGTRLAPAFRYPRTCIRGQERQNFDQVGYRVFNGTGITYNVSFSFFFFQIFKNLFYFEIIFNSEELGKQYREFPPTQLLLLLTCYLTMEQLSKLRRWPWRRAVNYRPDSGSPAFPLAIFVLWDPLWVPRVLSSASLWLLGP